MVENFTKRFTRIVSGSFNAMVDSVEGISPEMMMQETVRELDVAMDDIRAEKGQATAEKYLAQKRLTEQNNKHSDVQANIELAVSQGRDDLAEVAITKQMDIELQMPILEQAVNDALENENQCDKYIMALDAKRREMVDEIQKYIKDQKEVEAIKNPNHAGAESSMAAFDTILNKNKKVVTKQYFSNDEEKLAELDSLARQSEVKKRLDSFKNSDN